MISPPSAPASSVNKAKSKAKAPTSAAAAAPATTVPSHVLDHLLDLLVGCGDLPPSFHTTATADASLVTEAYLVAKLQSTLDARGHVPFHQLTALLQVNQQTADHILDLVLGGGDDSHGSVLLVDSFVVTQAGYKSLERQLVDLVTERGGGVAKADTLASATGTSTGLVYLVLDKLHVPSPVSRDSIDTSVYYSSSFATSLTANLADTLSNATEPTDIRPILVSTGCPAGLWQSTLHALAPTLQGRLSNNSLYTPTSYLTLQLDQFRSLLSTAGYIPLATIPPSVLPQLLATDPPPWSLASVLISASHARALKDTLKALAQEATGDALDDLVVDVTGQAGSVLDSADAIAFLTLAFPHTSSATASIYLTSGSKLAYRPVLVRAALGATLAPVIASILAAVPAGDAPSRARADVTRAMVATHVPGLPARMRDVLLPDLVMHVQAGVDAALAFRSDTHQALAYWLARLGVYAADVAKLGLARPVVKVLDRGMLRRVGPQLRDALVALMPAGGDDAGQVEAVVTQAVEVKSAAVVRKVVETVARAHGIAVPGDEAVQAERRVIKEEIVSAAEEWRGGEVGSKRGRAGEEEEDDEEERASSEWWRVAERLAVERDLVVWLDPSVPDEVVRAVVDKVFGEGS